MVGFVIVSHSENLAKSVVELTSIMAPSAKIAQAGGMDDGGFGTSFEKIQAAIESVFLYYGYQAQKLLGTAVMTTEMVIETYEGKKVEMVDCPLVEGAVVATINSVGGMSFEAIKKALAGVGTSRKF